MCRRFLASFATGCVVASALIACGDDTKPSASDRVARAVSTTLGNQRVTVAVSIKTDEDFFQYVEYVDFKAKRSFLASDDEQLGVATESDGTIYLRTPAFEEFTDGRWLRLSRDEIDEVASQTKSEYGDLSGLIFQGGITLNALLALKFPGETSVIGREVIDGRATSHFLAEPIIGGLTSPVEVWISDDENIVQIRYLSTNDVGDAIDVTAIVTIDRSAGPAFPVASLSVTSGEIRRAQELEEERIAAELAQQEELEAAKAEAEANPVGTSSVTAEMIGEALNSWLELGGIVEGTFVLPGLDQICLGISDIGGEVESLSIGCERLLSAEAKTALCPTAAGLAEAMANGQRVEIATIAAELAATADDLEQTGLSTSWASFTPNEVEGPAPLELQSSEEAGTSIRDKVFRISELWGRETDVGYYATADNVHAFVGVTCGVDLYLNYDVFQNEPPPFPSTALPDGSTDPLAAFAPFEVGDAGAEVSEAQRLLIISGQSLWPDGPDGTFGPTTRRAVETFQASRNIPMTGFIDLLTLSELRSAEQSSGAAPISATDPPCLSVAEFRSAIIDSGKSPDFHLVYVLCSGKWAKAVHTIPDFADGSEVLVVFDGSGWSVVGWADGPDNVCEMHGVPDDNRPPIGC